MYSMEELSRHLKQLIKKHNVKAVGYAVLNEDDISDNIIINTELSTQEDTSLLPHLFQGCSLSKPILALGIMLLIQQGRLHLDDKVAEKLLSWKLPKCCDQSITIRQCLAMTSGLGYASTSISSDSYLQTEPIPHLQHILEGTFPAKTGKIVSQYPAGTHYSYSGAGYMLLQQLIEDLTQQPYFKYIAETIFNPLGMSHSTMLCPLPTKQHSLVIPGYDNNGKQNPNGWYNNPYTGSGGLWTTARDMALFMREIIHAFNGNGSLLQHQALAYDMLASQSQASFGLGFSIDNHHLFYVRKQGYNHGYYHQLIMSSQTKKGLIIMTNSASAKQLIATFIEYYMDGTSYQSDFEEVKTIALAS